MTTPISITENIDCMEAMKRLPDNYFQLSICDPPYGVGMSGYETRPKSGNGSKWQVKQWDSAAPTGSYFDELFRVSINQVIWGANHFTTALPNSRGWVLWSKDTNGNFSDGELAFTSFDRPLRIFNFTWDGCRQGNNARNKERRIHPTQKPVALYKWLLTNYAKPGDKILDTHLGSQSSRIAAWDLGFDFYGCELDEDYFREGNERFERHRA